MYIAISIKNGYLMNSIEDNATDGDMKSFKIIEKQNIAPKTKQINLSSKSTLKVIDENEFEYKLLNDIIIIDEKFRYIDSNYISFCERFKNEEIQSIYFFNKLSLFKIENKDVDQEINAHIFGKLYGIDYDINYDQKLLIEIKKHLFNGKNKYTFYNMYSMELYHISPNMKDTLKINSNVLYKIFIDSSDECKEDEKLIQNILINFLNFVLQKFILLEVDKTILQFQIINLEIRNNIEMLQKLSTEEGLVMNYCDFKKFIIFTSKFWNDSSYEDFFLQKDQYCYLKKRVSCTLFFEQKYEEELDKITYILKNISLFKQFDINLSLQIINYIFFNNNMNVSIIISDKQNSFIFCNYNISAMFDKCLEQYGKNLINSFFTFKISDNFTRFQMLSIEKFTYDQIFDKEKNEYSIVTIDNLINQLNSLKIKQKEEEDKKINKIKEN
jgi:hypothetical protein